MNTTFHKLRPHLKDSGYLGENLVGTLKELQRPDSLEQYKKYILQKYKPTIGFGDEFEQKFLRNQAIVSHMIKDSVFWKELLKDLREIDVNYRMKNKNLDLIPYLEKIELNKRSQIALLIRCVELVFWRMIFLLNLKNLLKN